LFDRAQRKAGERVRIGILWTGLAGYLNACFRELATRDGVELFVAHKAPALNAPYDESQFGWIKNRLMWRNSDDLASLKDRLKEFDPQVLIMAGWFVPAYRSAAKALAGKCFRVMTMDNSWTASPKQKLATWTSSYYIWPIADAAWIPGERQAVFARKLGFEPHEILHGLLCCDQRLEATHKNRISADLPVPRAFLYVGRFVQEKGIDTLVQAYEMYRANTPKPWPLICCGAGPLRSLLDGKPGIQVEGFLQPEQLRLQFGRAGCFVLPSDFEPWAVVINEAALAGLPILASEKVGAAVHLVQDHYNGYIFGAGDIQGLASLFGRVSAMTNERLDAMSRASHSLALQFSPVRWADTLLDKAEQWAERTQAIGSRPVKSEAPQAVRVKSSV
jgi:glycosyltransferase involved in cell wall biosynthesis